MSERLRESAVVEADGIGIQVIERVAIQRGRTKESAWLVGLVEPVAVLVRDASGERRIELPR